MKVFPVLSSLLLILNGCNNPSGEPKADSTPVVAASAAVSQADLKPDSVKTVKTDNTPKLANRTTTTDEKWKYETMVDKTTGKSETTASVLSKNTPDSKSPDNASNPSRLMLKQNHEVTYVIVAINKGKFKTDVDGATIKVKFDQGSFEPYVSTKSNDGQPTLLFVDNSDKFIKKLKTAREVTVQADIDQLGTQTMVFDVEGLNWPVQ